MALGLIDSFDVVPEQQLLIERSYCGDPLTYFLGKHSEKLRYDPPYSVFSRYIDDSRGMDLIARNLRKLLDTAKPPVHRLASIYLSTLFPLLPHLESHFNHAKDACLVPRQSFQTGTALGESCKVAGFDTTDFAEPSNNLATLSSSPSSSTLTGIHTPDSTGDGTVTDIENNALDDKNDPYCCWTFCLDRTGEQIIRQASYGILDVPSSDSRYHASFLDMFFVRRDKLQEAKRMWKYSAVEAFADRVRLNIRCDSVIKSYYPSKGIPKAHFGYFFVHKQVTVLCIVPSPGSAPNKAEVGRFDLGTMILTEKSHLESFLRMHYRIMQWGFKAMNELVADKYWSYD